MTGTTPQFRICSHLATLMFRTLHLIPPGSTVALSTMLPIGALSGATIVMVEAGGMAAERPRPFVTDGDQATAAVANQNGLLFVLPANIGSW